VYQRESGQPWPGWNQFHRSHRGDARDAAASDGHEHNFHDGHSSGDASPGHARYGYPESGDASPGHADWPDRSYGPSADREQHQLGPNDQRVHYDEPDDG
jgi:hypothetical protein